MAGSRRYRRQWPAIFSFVVLCSILVRTRAFRLSCLTGRRHSSRSHSAFLQEEARKRNGLPRAGGQGVAVTMMGLNLSAGWSLDQVIATALATLQIASTGAPTGASWPEPLSSPSLSRTLANSEATPASASPPNSETPKVTAQRGPFEEVWSLSNQFYFDRTHRGNDWETVKSRLSAEIASGQKSEKKATKEMLALLEDKYTRLIDPELYDMLSKYDLIGVGVMLSPNQAGQLVVASPPKTNSQAEKLGVKKGDLILSINGLDSTKLDSFGVTDYLAMYQGKTITFGIRSPEEGSDLRSVELERTFPSTENPVVYALKEQGEHKVGYARLRDFNSIVARKLREALVEMKAAGADEFVLDLRGNSGGAFQSALGVAGLFMNGRPITYIVDGSGQRAEFMTKKDAVVTEEPLVVWVDGFSASSSEVLAGALQDDCRAVLRGGITFGKGLVQAVYGLEDGEGLILTVAQYETPRGNYIHGKGIKPDIRGGLPPKLISGNLKFDQSQFDAARERMRACPPMEASRVGFKGAAGASASGL
ncbi:unnamed protein product [Ascophyllum nodosum]